MAQATVKQLRQKHPEYSREWLEMIAALAEGGKRWHSRITQIIPKNSVEPTDIYADRQARASYTNHMSGILGMIVGHLFAKPPEMSGGGPYWEATLEQSADQKGTTWGKWWANALLDALINRQSFAWVNIPGNGDQEFANLAEQEGSGALDAYLVPISGEDVIDWGEDAHGNLEWLITETQDWTRNGIGSRTVTWRWVHYDAKAITTYEWRSSDPSVVTPAPGEKVAGTEVAHNYGLLPVARLRLPVGLWAGNKLRDPALGLTRAENDLDWSLYQAAHALLVIKSKWSTDAPVLGAGYYLRLMQDDEALYVEPSGSSYEHQANRIKAKQEALYRVVQQLAAGAEQTATTQARSAESKNADWKATEIVLSAYATQVLGAMKDTAAIVGEVMKARGKAPQIGGLDGYKEESTQSFLETAALAIDARQMSPTFAKVVAKQEAKRILGDEVSEEEMKVILDEIDAAVIEPAGIFQPTPDLDEDVGEDG